MNYYKILKISENASQEEIKSSFRKLALVYHPDRSTGNQAAFVAISEAYSVLSNLDKKRIYDLSINPLVSQTTTAHARTSSSNQRNCQACNRIAPLKHVKLLQNIGLLFERRSKQIEGNFCKNCIDKYFARLTLKTFIFGWWGIISFFVTIWYLLNNIFVFLGSIKMKKSF